MVETNPETNPDNSETAIQRGRARRRTLPLIFTIVVVCVSAWACFVWINSAGEFDFRRFTFQTPEKIVFYPVTGEVWFNDELIKTGHVEAHPVQKGHGPTRVIGTIKEDGSFELYSDSRSGMVQGATAGEYKLLLMVHHPASGYGYPAKLLPEKYYTVAATPITIIVRPEPEKNHFVVKESGELNLNAEETKTLDEGKKKEK